MRFLHLTTHYPSYLQRFYADHPALAQQAYDVQLQALLQDSFAGADFWTHALESLGYKTLNVISNAAPLQLSWWRENRGDVVPADAHEIAVEQAKAFRPDILWFDDQDELLLRKLKQALPSLRLVLGWTGSAIPENTFDYRQVDLMLSCAPESVEILRDRGVAAEQLHHGFDSRILSRLTAPKSPKLALSFIGQIVRGSQFHNERARLLEQLGAELEIAIYSEIASLGPAEDLKAALKSVLFHTYRSGSALGFGQVLDRVPVLRRLAGKTAAPLSQRNRKLQPFLHPPLFGLAMYQAVRDSLVSLNIHADSSPRYASNMRLFEATGMGTCLLTDWRENLPELFHLDEEVVCYRSPEECVEKARWLCGHPEEAARIGAAGQRRTLKDHTFLTRAERLDKFIRKRI